MAVKGKGNTPLALLLLTPGFAAVGFLLRRWQAVTAFEFTSGLLTPGKPATYALVAWLGLAAVVTVVLAWRALRGKTPKGYLANFAAPNLGVGIATLVAGAVLFAGGVLGIRDFALHMDARVARLVLGLCLVPCGVCVGLVGLLGQQRQEGKGRFAGVLLAPGYCACVWLLVAYQGHTANPNMMEYVFLLLGIVCAVFACYASSSFSFEKPLPVGYAASSAMGVVLLAVAGADRPWGMDALILWGFALYLYVQLVCLLFCRMRPPKLKGWTPLTQEEETAPEEPREETLEDILEEFTAEPEKQVQPRGEEDE